MNETLYHITLSRKRLEARDAPSKYTKTHLRTSGLPKLMSKKRAFSASIEIWNTLRYHYWVGRMGLVWSMVGCLFFLIPPPRSETTRWGDLLWHNEGAAKWHKTGPHLITGLAEWGLVWWSVVFFSALYPFHGRKLPDGGTFYDTMKVWQVTQNWATLNLAPWWAVGRSGHLLSSGAILLYFLHWHFRPQTLDLTVICCFVFLLKGKLFQQIKREPQNCNRICVE